MNKDKLARAALMIAQDLGAREEWNDPAAILESIAATLQDQGGVPAVDKSHQDSSRYWQYMSVDDALEAAECDHDAVQAGHNLSIYLDAAQANPETIDAIFSGMQRLVRGEPEPLRSTAVTFLRSADS